MLFRSRLRTRRRVRAAPIEDAEDIEAPGHGVGLPEREALQDSLNELSPEQRTVIVLRYFGDLPLEAIADRTGERLGTVKSRLHYALAALRAAYDAADRSPGRMDR